MEAPHEPIHISLVSLFCYLASFRFELSALSFACPVEFPPEGGSPFYI